jgi:lysophospholipase L1-like esterase
VRLTESLVAAFRAEVEATGADFVTVSLPVRGQRRSGEYPAGVVEPPYARRLAALQSWLEQVGVPLIDLLPVFADLPADTYYYQRDGHMRPPGHVLIANRLQPELATRLYARLDSERP